MADSSLANLPAETLTFNFYGLGRYGLAGVHPHERCQERVECATWDEAEQHARELLVSWPDVRGIEYYEVENQHELYCVYREVAAAAEVEV